MSDQLQKYFAAVFGCIIATTWVASGLGAALAGAAAAAVAFAIVAFAQGWRLPSPGHLTLVERRPAGRPIHPRGRPTKRVETQRTATTQSSRRDFESDPRLGEDPSSGLDQSTRGYGW